MTLAAISSSDGPSLSFSCAATSASNRFRGLTRSSGFAAQACTRFRDQAIDELSDFLHGNGHLAVFRQLYVTPIWKKCGLSPRNCRKHLVQMILNGIFLFLQRVDVPPECESAGHVDGEPDQVGMGVKGHAGQGRPPPAATQPPDHLLEAGNKFPHMARVQHVHHVLPLTSPFRALCREQSVGFDVGNDLLDLVPATKAIGPVAQQLLDYLGISDREDACCGHPENEQGAELVGPAGNKAMQLRGFQVEGVTREVADLADRATRPACASFVALECDPRTDGTAGSSILYLRNCGTRPLGSYHATRVTATVEAATGATGESWW